MVLYEILPKHLQHLSMPPAGTFVIIKFFPNTEKFETTIYPFYNPAEREVFIMKYLARCDLPLSKNSVPLFHELATVPNLLKFKDSTENRILFRKDTMHEDEYLDLLENTYILPVKPHKTKQTTKNFVAKKYPMKNVSFVQSNTYSPPRNEGFPI